MPMPLITRHQKDKEKIMHIQKNTVVLIAALSLAACTSSKGCNETATDTCLTMDAVNAMTQSKNSATQKRAFKASSNDTVLWIAPFDKEVSNA